MSSFTKLFSLKAPNKPSVKNQMVLLIGAESLSWGIVRETFCQALFDTIYGSHTPREIIRFEITPRSLLIHTVGWND